MNPPPPDTATPHLIAWEVTRSCILACRHCRAASQPGPYEGELSGAECRRLLDNIASFARPIIILTGGEPMLRPDIYDIAAHGRNLGLPVVMATCGTLIDDESAGRIVRAGIHRISISLDGATAASHDRFRGVAGAFDGAIRGIAAARRAGLDFQINTTITRHNVAELPEILQLAVQLGASVFNPFALVPTGRGEQLAGQEPTAQQYEQTLHWLAERQGSGEIQIRVTCAPHYQRILRQRGEAPHRTVTGCMGGRSFAFISHRGKVQICGFLDVECGDARRENFDFRRIWETSEVFRQVRDVDGYHGRCGECEFRRVCGGCRARAYATSGDWLGEEPFCTHQPRRSGAADLDEPDRKILSVIQTDFPVCERPYDGLAERVGAGEAETLARVGHLRADGIIRRLGAVFDSGMLGYASTLVAARIPPARLDKVAHAVNLLAGVTHNYRREHNYNLWFTLTAESEAQIAGILDRLREETGIADFHSLPALKVYKIRAAFNMTQTPAPSEPAVPVVPAGPVADLDDGRKQLVRLLQEDLPAGPHPFAILAEKLGRPAASVTKQINDWLAQGVIRRFGAVVRHRRLGFTANSLAAMRVEGDLIDTTGQRLAGLPEVSHCYRRTPLPGFPYELFAMVHGRSAGQVRRCVDRFAAEAGVSDYVSLPSTREYKKTSMKYFV